MALLNWVIVIDDVIFVTPLLQHPQAIKENILIWKLYDTAIHELSYAYCHIQKNPSCF
jgi:hypothetical protein